MAEILVSIAEGSLTTLLALYAGLFFARQLASAFPRYLVSLAAISSGIIFWLFVDALNGAAQLNVNRGLSIDYTSILLVVSFAVGLILPLFLERRMNSRSNTSAETVHPDTRGAILLAGFSFPVATTVALAIGFHGMGEGDAIGSLIPSAGSILDATGGLASAFSFLSHKVLEGFVIGVVAALGGAVSYKKIGILGLVAGVPVILGILIGIPSLIQTTYFFALGAAGAIYIELKLLPAFDPSDLKYSTILFVLLGFYLVYIAALPHSGAP